MPLTATEKELVNIGASVATGCKPCTDYHFQRLRELQAPDEQIRRAMTDALAVRDSAREVMESHGLAHLGAATEVILPPVGEQTDRLRELVSIGAAVAVNCTGNLQRHLLAARALGISEHEIASVADAAAFVRDEAIHYVGEIVQLRQRTDQLEQLLQELQQTQAELVQSEKMAALGKLVAGLFHELNSPLGAIISFSDVARRAIRIIVEVLQGAETLEQVQGSRRLQDSIRALEDSVPLTLEASDRVARLFAGLKSFIRVDEAEFQLADLHEGLQSVLTLAEHDLQGRIEVKMQLGEIPRIPCYPAELNQVLMALLNNAIQAIEGRGTITIRTHLEDGAVHLELSDTGVGIPPEALNKLFVPEFARRGSRVKTRLGLFTSYNIIQKHGGEIRVRSEPGQGSTFTVVLPTDLKPPADEPAEKSDDLQPAHRCDKA